MCEFKDPGLLGSLGYLNGTEPPLTVVVLLLELQVKMSAVCRFRLFLIERQRGSNGGLKASVAEKENHSGQLKLPFFSILFHFTQNQEEST